MLPKSDTIAAIATAQAPAAIGIVRISGPDAADVLGRVVRDRPVSSRRVVSGWARMPGSDDLIDEVLCFYCRGPATATGEDTAEIHGHGGPLVLRRLLEAALNAGARAAEPGEFTYRAFQNNRIDLTQAEAIMGLIGARSDRAREVAVSHLSGHLGDTLNGHFDTVNRISAHVEAGLDFPDEDLPLALTDRLADELSSLGDSLERLRDSFSLGAKLEGGAKIGIIGPPNVGKSSLFNRLVNDDRAIVDDTPGTTRDVVEAHGVIAGIPVVFLDTAGVRRGESRVEQMGIDRSLAVAETADIVILVVDGTVPLSNGTSEGYLPFMESAVERAIVALNKVDLPEWSKAALSNWDPRLIERVVPVSALRGDGVDRLVRRIGRNLEGDAAGETVILTTARQHSAVSETLSHVRVAARLLREGADAELAAAELLWARDRIAALLGRSATDDMLSALFSEFCIGK